MRKGGMSDIEREKEEGREKFECRVSDLGDWMTSASDWRRRHFSQGNEGAIGKTKDKSYFDFLISD